MSVRVGLVALAMIASAGCADRRPATVAIPLDGATEVVLDDHLPDGFRITRVTGTLDGERVIDETVLSSRTSLFRARIPEGDHALRLEIEVSVPCGLFTAPPSEKLTATVARSFKVGPTGGLVHVDAFAQSAWQNPAERVHVLVSLRGLAEGRWLYGRSPEAKQACGRLGPIERSRCVVQRLVDRSLAQRDVAGLLCQKDKLQAIDDLLEGLDDADRRVEPLDARGAGRGREAVTPSLIARVEQLEREAEYCVPEDLAWMGEQQVTSDRSACAAYDEPAP